MDQLTPEQLDLWKQYAPARERIAAGGRSNPEAEIVSGFASVCGLEGVPAPSDEAIRRELRHDG